MASFLRTPLFSVDLSISSRIDDSLRMSASSSLRVRRPGTADLKVSGSVKRNTCLIVQASKEPLELTRELREKQKTTFEEKNDELDPFEELKPRFLNFKKRVYLENLDHYQNLAEGQAPKFMVIACADSRVCPSKHFGVSSRRSIYCPNVANLVPPFQHGASEVNAGLEFAVNSLQVANILVVGHSRCGGIRALMSMKRDDDTRSFIRDWVSIGKTARLSTEAAAGNLSFEKQCKHCEKESVNTSLLNLLTYPWIEERVNEGTLSLHGGYYDFTDCSFEKWTLVYRQCLEGGSKYSIKNRSFWS
ncbi:hypothetical protein J5N97_000820 [Dioscorea zingiberensis]|uniref:Carbonic anhydrase n=1 Tax=Dioscorea zingiberensis TaxID=325984 RepID=A0A9D5BUZ3_9LILI|nr:hypothetical protein J5N97_000820 [Dioscorea zingiberensis]